MNSETDLRDKLSDIEVRAHHTKYPEIKDELAALLRMCTRSDGGHCHMFMQTLEKVLLEDDDLRTIAGEYFSGAAMAKHHVLSQKARNGKTE